MCNSIICPYLHCRDSVVEAMSVSQYNMSSANLVYCETNVSLNTIVTVNDKSDLEN